MVDTGLIKRCQQEDEAAFGELYKTVGRKALWAAYLLAGRMDVAEDIIQETFFECFRDIKKLRKPELFQVWFNRILVRKCWDVVFKEKKHTAESLDDEEKEQLKSDCNVLETVEAGHVNSLIREAVGRLNPKMRTTVILFYYNNMSVREIAQAMNCFEGTVKSRLHYAKKVLEKKLRRELDGDCFNKLNYPGKECIVNEQ